jgi:hypothetical protein
MVAPTVTFAPATPEPAKDGIFVTVTGEVPVLAHLKITDASTRVRAVSPVFKQGLNPTGVVSNQKTSFYFDTGTEGTFTVKVTDGDTNEYTTDPVYWYDDAPTYAYPDADDLSAALLDALPTGSDVGITKSGRTTMLEFKKGMAGRPLTVLVTASGMTKHQTTVAVGGTAGTSFSGPFKFGPLFLADETYAIDLVADEADGDLSIAKGDSLLTAPVALEVAPAI